MKNIIFRGKIDRIGNILMAVSNNDVLKMGFERNTKKFAKDLPHAKWQIKKFNKKLIRWFKNYKNGQTRNFPYRFNPAGTRFQIDVWDMLKKIPCGETRTYKWIAEKIGKPSAYRAVGTACGANPIPIAIPCHRVVSSTGLGGFSGGVNMKRRLIRLEHPKSQT